MCDNRKLEQLCFVKPMSGLNELKFDINLGITEMIQFICSIHTFDLGREDAEEVADKDRPRPQRRAETTRTRS